TFRFLPAAFWPVAFVALALRAEALRDAFFFPAAPAAFRVLLAVFRAGMLPPAGPRKTRDYTSTAGTWKSGRAGGFRPAPRARARSRHRRSGASAGLPRTGQGPQPPAPRVPSAAIAAAVRRTSRHCDNRHEPGITLDYREFDGPLA